MTGGYQIVDFTKYTFPRGQAIDIYDNKLWKKMQNIDKVPLIKLTYTYTEEGSTINVNCEGFGVRLANRSNAKLLLGGTSYINFDIYREDNRIRVTVI